MRILFLTNQYYPLKAANELCIYNMINYFVDSYCFFICFGQEEEVIHQNNISIYSIKNVIKKKLSNFILYVIREIPFRILSFFYRPVIRRKSVEKYILKAEEIINNYKLDVIFSELNPIESVEAGYLIKKKYPEIKYVIYDIDTLSNRNFGILEKLPLLKKMYLNTVKRYEKKVYSKADLIIHFNCHKKHFLDDFYKEFSYKTLFLGIPVLNIVKRANNVYNKDFIYAGRFYGPLRDPKILINIFAKVFEKLNSKLHIYTNGDYVKNIPKALSVKDSNSVRNILVHNYVEQAELNEITDKIGFLVSLGNSYTDMFPSKIISYVGSLKPIIHIYQTEDDPVIEFLKKYPDALLINSKDSLEINSNKIIEFVNSERPVIEPEFIKEIYKENLPEYSANKIMNFLDNIFNRVGHKNEN